MKTAALILECADGKFHAIGAGSIPPLRELAKKARATGEIEIGKKAVKIVAGSLLASWRPVPDLQFRCR